MKTLCRILLLAALLAVPARAAQQITMVVWPTNSVSHSNNLTFNSTDTRYAVTNITNAAKQWPATNSAGWVATNLFTHLAAYPPLGFASYGIQWSGTNTSAFWVIAPTGSNITATVVGSWARVTYFTNNYATTTNVVVPLAAITNTARSNITSGIIEWLNQNPAAAAHVIDALAPAFAKFLNNSNGVQTFTNKNFRGGTNTFTYLAGASGQLSNVGVVNLVATNFSSPGTGTLSIAIGASAQAGTYGIAIGDSTDAAGPFSVVIGALNSSPSGEGAVAVGNQTTPSGYGSVTIGTDAGATTNFATAIGYGATAAHLNSTALGESSTTTASNQVRIGVSYDTVSVPGNFDLIGTGTVARLVVTNLAAQAGQLTNVAIAASGLTATQATVVTLNASNGTLGSLKLHAVENTGVLTNSGVMLTREWTVSSLAAGNNIIERGTNNRIYFSGTAGAATLCAITNGFGDGDCIEAVNGTGYNLTVANQSGFTTIPANRILTVNGASNVTVFPGGWLVLRYSSNDARWRLVYPEVFSAVATNAIASADGTGSNTFLIAPVFAGYATNTNSTAGQVWTATSANGHGAWSNAASASGAYVAQVNGVGTNLAASFYTGATNDPFQVQNTNGTPLVVVKTNGLVGVGTNTPAYKLQTHGTNAASAHVATVVGTAANPAFQFADGRGFYQDATGGGSGIGVSPSGSLRITLGNVGVEMGAGLYVGWSSASSPNNTPDACFTRAAQGVVRVQTNLVAIGTVTATNGFLSGSNVTFRGIATTNTPPAGHAGLFAATNAGTVELMAIDSAGNITQISAHAMDSPGLAADDSPLPMILRHRNDYVGTEEWIHLSALAREVERLSGKRFVFTNAVAKRSWNADQAAAQADWNAARSAELADRAAGNTNANPRPARDVRQPVPAWMNRRGQ